MESQYNYYMEKIMKEELENYYMEKIMKEELENRNSILECIIVATFTTIEIFTVLVTFPLFYALNRREERIVERMMRLQNESNK